MMNSVNKKIRKRRFAKTFEIEKWINIFGKKKKEREKKEMKRKRSISSLYMSERKREREMS